MERYIEELNKLPTEVLEYVNKNIDRFIDEYENTPKNNAKRYLAELEKYYILSNIPKTKTPFQRIGQIIDEELTWKTKILLDTIQLYPSLIDNLRTKIHVFANTSKIHENMGVAGDAVDAIMEPVMQASLDSFKSAGSGTETTSNVSSMSQVLDISSNVEKTNIVIIPHDRHNIDQIAIDLIEAKFKDILLDKEVGSASIFTPNEWYQKLDSYTRILDEDYVGIRLKLDVDMMQELDVKIHNISDTLEKLGHIYKYSPVFTDVNDAFYMYVDIYVIRIPSNSLAKIPITLADKEDQVFRKTPHMIEEIGNNFIDYKWYQDYVYKTDVIPIKANMVRAYYLYMPEEVEGIVQDGLEAEIISQQFTQDSVINFLENRNPILEEDIEMLEEMQNYIKENGNFTIVDYYFKSKYKHDISTSSKQERDLGISEKDFIKSYINMILLNSIDDMILTGSYNIRDANVDDIITDDLILSSYSTGKGTWILVFKLRLLQRYKISVEQLLYKSENPYVYEHINDYMIEVQSRSEPILNSIDLRFINTLGGNFEDILSDIRINGELTITDNINQAVETLGIEAARNVLINSIASRNKEISSNTNYRHLMLFADLITRSGKLSKTTTLGTYEPSSHLNVASFSSALNSITKSLISDVGTNLDIYGQILIGQQPVHPDEKKDEFIEQEDITSYKNVIYDMPNEPKVEKFDDVFIPEFLE